MVTDPTLLRMARAMCPMDWEKASGDIRSFWLERARLGLNAVATVSGSYRYVEVGWKNGEWYRKEEDPDTGNAGALE